MQASGCALRMRSTSSRQRQCRRCLLAEGGGCFASSAVTGMAGGADCSRSP